ncbi:arrestin-C-like isoform X2 [Clupea harengus]|uniref:Arrestin-C n=2 Tax=Clupea harengus TaxID=7950 RepID=A0A6P8FW35_CLUHA|nr:arrestin-C-like isoform X2 [Clupea harengus]
MAKVFKKASRNGQLVLYLGKRDFVDHVESVDPVEGVLKIDQSALGGRKVWLQMTCAFRYGSEDLDVIGLSFRKDIWMQHLQLFPPAGHNPTITPLHEALQKKAGEEGLPFTIEIPTNLPCSVTLQPGEDNKSKACGVDFEVKAYMAMEADNPDEQVDKQDTCRLIIRKIQYAPNQTGPGPKLAIMKCFMTSDKPVHMELSLDKEIFYHGNPIPVKIKVTNKTSKVINKVKISVDQTTDVVLYSADKYTKNILSQEFLETIEAEGTFEKALSITPLLANNKDKKGLALDGKLKDEDTNLASSAIIRPGMERDIMGILVSYKIKVNLVSGGGGFLGGLTASEVTGEIPLILMHPKPKA